MTGSTASSSPKADRGGYVSLQDDLCIPPPPPIPPPSRIIPPTPTLPEPHSSQRNSSLSAELHRKFMELFGTSPRTPLSDLPKPNEPFESKVYFFYGSLTDPEVLQKVIQSVKVPILTPAKVKGFRVMMWGIYPALVPDASAESAGMIWKVESKDQLARLRRYETNAYSITTCEVHTDDGEVFNDCRTFCFKGNPESPELKEGSFDRDRFKLYFKPSLLLSRGD